MRRHQRVLCVAGRSWVAQAFEKTAPLVSVRPVCRCRWSTGLGRFGVMRVTQPLPHRRPGVPRLVSRSLWLIGPLQSCLQIYEIFQSAGSVRGSAAALLGLLRGVWASRTPQRKPTIIIEAPSLTGQPLADTLLCCSRLFAGAEHHKTTAPWGRTPQKQPCPTAA